MQAIWLAVIVGIGAVVTPLGTVWLTARMQRNSKQQDWARQDEVAAQAARAAALLLERQEKVGAQAAEAAALLLASNERVAKQSAESSRVTNNKLDGIHELVNSNLSKQMAENHEALQQQLVLMLEVIRLNRLAGREPSGEALQAVEVIRARVAELGAQLEDRAKATDIAAAKGGVQQ